MTRVILLQVMKVHYQVNLMQFQGRMENYVKEANIARLDKQTSAIQGNIVIASRL